MLYKVLIAHEPVHDGQGGPILPAPFGQLSVIIACVPLLILLWIGVKREDFAFRKRGRILLFSEVMKDDQPDAPSSRDDRT
jgi:hypothetical protein